jgi:hypothetical protein
MFSTKFSKTTECTVNAVKSPYGAILFRADSFEDVFSTCVEKNVFKKWETISYRGETHTALSLSARCA